MAGLPSYHNFWHMNLQVHHLVDFLDVPDALRVMRLCSYVRDHPCFTCANVLHESFWDVSRLQNLSFSALSVASEGLMQCMIALRTDPRYMFHLHYLAGLPSCGNRIEEQKALRELGSMRGWRPGKARPRRDATYQQLLSDYPGSDDTYEPDIEVYMAAKLSDIAFSHRVSTLFGGLFRSASRFSGSPPGQFFDIEYGLGIFCRRHPVDMLNCCGLAGIVKIAGTETREADPVAVWMLHVDASYTLDTSTGAVFGWFDTSGDFVLASILEHLDEDGDPLLSLDDKRLDAQMVAAVTIRYHSWTEMHHLLLRCWAYVDEKLGRSKSTNQSYVRPFSNKGALLDPSCAKPDQWFALRLFQQKFHEYVLDEVGVEFDLVESKWTWPSAASSDTFSAPSRDVDSNDWVFYRNASIVPKIGGVLRVKRVALACVRRTFHEAVGVDAYLELCTDPARQPEDVDLHPGHHPLTSWDRPLTSWSPPEDVD